MKRLESYWFHEGEEGELTGFSVYRDQSSTTFHIQTFTPPGISSTKWCADIDTGELIDTHEDEKGETTCYKLFFDGHPSIDELKERVPAVKKTG